MSVKLLLGRAGSGKTTKCLEEIKQTLLTSPDGGPILYLVPDQMTFQTEYHLISTPELDGMVRAQVFSFSRLAWRVLQETGGISRYHLNNIGVNMLIRKIIEEKKDKWKIFSRSADKNGFIDYVEQILTEFKRYCISPEILEDKIQIFSKEEGGNRALADKLHDLKLIYEQFEENLQGKYLDSEDYFQLLSEKIPESAFLKEADIYVDGFHSFTPQEYLVLTNLMKYAKSVTLALTVEKPNEQFQNEDWQLFRMTGETLQTVLNIIHNEGINIEENVMLNDLPRFKESPSLRHLEKHFDTRPLTVFQEHCDIHICQAVNRRAEIEGIARKIKSLIRQKKWRYREVAVLIRNEIDYQEMIETVFDDEEIPFFIDQKSTMLNHPLIELLRSSLEVITSYWRYDPVFRAIKTDLLFPIDANINKIRGEMDKLENYVLAHGIQGDKWLKKDRWVYRRFRGLELVATPQTTKEKEMEQRLNELRLMISAPILRLSRRFKKCEKGRDFCEALYLYVEELNIPEKLEQLKLEAENRGNLVLARKHDQAWNAIMDLLDQFVEMLGNEKLSVKQFTGILEAGFESMRFSLVPPAMDQVLIGNLETSRFSNIKAAFVIGLNEGVLPAKMNEEGLLADEDRERLQQQGLKIAASTRMHLIDEQFIAYKAFTTPSHQLFLSFPLANEEGKALMASPFIKRIKEMFPNLHEHFMMNDPSELSDIEQLEYTQSKRGALTYLTSQLSLMKRQYPISDFWWDVYNFYMSEKQLMLKTKHVLSSLFYKNSVRTLSQDIGKELYGDVIQGSVSRMESFQSCPFAHFAHHGLRLRERNIYRLEAPDIGEMFHGALKVIADELLNNERSWASLTKDECNKMAKYAVEKLAPKLQHEILLSTNRHYYLLRKLESVISRASYILSEHSKVSGFSPIGLELAFGPEEKIPPLTFTLKDGTKMQLAGRIDRIDRADDDRGVFLRVIDYKSSGKELKLNEVYYGLALQMMTYLDVVISHSPTLIGTKASPAGVLYFHVHNPMIKGTKMLTLDQIEEEILKSFKMKGLLLGDPDVIRLMDNTLEEGKTSQIVSAGIKKDGTLTSKSKVATEEEFTIMRSYVRKLYEETGNSIVSGQVDITPYKLKDKIPCTVCSYKSVCQIDPALENNEYRILPTLTKEQLIEKMREGVQ